MFRRGKGGRLESLHNELQKETGSLSGEFSALQSSSDWKAPVVGHNATYPDKSGTSSRELSDNKIIPQTKL
jgi:hypothetical protein